MPDRPIKIEFLAEVSKWLSETRKVDVSLEDLSDALVAVSNDGDDLQRKLSAAMKRAERDTDTLERAIKDIGDAAGRAADEGGKGFKRFGDDARKTGDDVESDLGDAGKAGGRNFATNLTSGLASGDYGAVLTDTIADFASEVSGPGSAAIAAGATLALLLWNEFAQNEAAKARAQATIFSAFDEVTGQLNARQLLETAYTELGGGDFSQGLLDAKNYAEALNLSTAEYAELISGQVNPRTDATKQTLADQVVNLERLKQQQDGLTPGQEAYLDAAKQTLGTVGITRDGLQDAGEAQKVWNDALSSTGANADDLRGRLADAVSEAARIGTGNEYLDGLLAKAEDIGFEALTAQEQAALIGSGNKALDGVKSTAEELRDATGNAKDNLGNLPDPTLPNAKAATEKINASLQTALDKLNEIEQKRLGDKTLRININPNVQGSGPGAAFIGKWVV